ncbi:hypothetical protein I4U23_025419 [Adineta vaga]|nr:hypothetical protein I4U23_025419 [Adineta vaga]
MHIGRQPIDLIQSIAFIDRMIQQSCLNLLLSSYQTSRFHSTTTTIQSLLKALFIEEILNETNYEEYYLICLSNGYSYYFMHRFNWLYVLTTLTGLCGGLLLMKVVLYCLKNIIMKTKDQLMEFNLYHKNTHDPILIYRGLKSISEIFANPSNEICQVLKENYSCTLRCSCTQISIPYEDFINIQMKYHQICSSDFIQPWWYQSILP